MNNKTLQFLLVAIQFGGIFFFLLTGKVYPQNWIVVTMLLTSVIVGVWAILSMNRATLTILPAARKNASLTTIGPYQLIRHPMYTAVLVFLLALLLNDFSYFRFLVFMLVLVDLNYKIVIEEAILLKKYAAYAEYKKQTRKLVPYLF